MPRLSYQQYVDVMTRINYTPSFHADIASGDMENVDIRRSTLIDSNGNRVYFGLFAKKNFPYYGGQGSYICAYTGQLILRQDGRADGYTSSYVWEYDNEFSIDAKHSITFGHLANDCIEEGRHNARIVRNPRIPYTAMLVTLKPIREGEEIFVDYGDNYWTGDDHFKLLNLELQREFKERNTKTHRWVTEYNRRHNTNI